MAEDCCTNPDLKYNFAQSRTLSSDGWAVVLILQCSNCGAGELAEPPDDMPWFSPYPDKEEVGVLVGLLEAHSEHVLMVSVDYAEEDEYGERLRNAMNLCCTSCDEVIGVWSWEEEIDEDSGEEILGTIAHTTILDEVTSFDQNAFQEAIGTISNNTVTALNAQANLGVEPYLPLIPEETEI